MVKLVKFGKNEYAVKRFNWGILRFEYLDSENADHWWGIEFVHRAKGTEKQVLEAWESWKNKITETVIRKLN